MGRYYKTVTESQRYDSGYIMSHHSHSMWQRSQLMSSMKTMRDKKHSHIVIVYIV